MTAWFTFTQPRSPRLLVKKFGPRWCVLRQVAEKRFVHVSDHDTHPEALDAAGWVSFWHVHELRALDLVGDHLIARYAAAAAWVDKHWGQR